MLRTFSPSSNPMELVSEAPLKPARKCLQSFGESFLDGGAEVPTVVVLPGGVVDEVLRHQPV